MDKLVGGEGAGMTRIEMGKLVKRTKEEKTLK